MQHKKDLYLKLRYRLDDPFYYKIYPADVNGNKIGKEAMFKCKENYNDDNTFNNSVAKMNI